MVQLRMAQQLRGRVDASDVLQEAFLDASRRLERYLKDPPMPFFLWLRYLTRQKLLELHRHHVGTKARDPRREVSLHRGAMPEATTEALAAQLLGHTSTPSEAAIRVEMQLRLQEALNSLDPLDREILALRHFEQLSNVEAARELGIAEAAASKRFIRALMKLKGILTHLGLKPDGG
jgi:RNA polymerase sigma-70 factor (ECF subfamily)